MFVISIVSFVLGIITITQKGYKKGLPISSTIMSGVILKFLNIEKPKALIP